jgi:hypothetical protein
MPLTDDIANIQTGLGNLWATTSNSASAATSSLNHQNDMISIIDQENQRLQAKKQQISGAVANTQRTIALNESYRKRQVQFIYIILLLILGLLIYMFLRNIQLFFPFIPSFIVEFLTILTMGAIFIYIVFLLRNISLRSNTNFDELNLPPPVINTAEDVEAKRNAAMNIGDVLGSIGYGNSCIGESCCDTTVSQWNMGTMKCVKKCDVPDEAAYKGACYKSGASITDGSSTLTAGTDLVLCGKAWIPKGKHCFVSENFEPMANGPQPNSASEKNLYSRV